jgi:post-segregation antitoxin (ccd killing protein)
MEIEMKKNVMIRIDDELIRKAKEYGLNISKISQNALKDMIDRIERPIQQNNSKKCPESSKNDLVRGVGFEPTEAYAMRA